MFIYIHKKENPPETFWYTKIQTFLKKQDNLRYVFIYKNLKTLRYAIFHEIVQTGIYIQKSWHFELRDIFMHKNSDTSQKARQFALHFYI